MASALFFRYSTGRIRTGVKKAEIRQGPAGSTVPFRRIVYDGGSGNGMGRVTRIDYGPFDLITDAPKLRESFSYTPAGLIAGRSVALRTYSDTYTAVGASFVHDNEGRRVRVNYPAGVTYSDGAWRQDPSISYEYAFDAKGRISTMTEKNSVYGDTTVASGVSYNLAGQMTAATVFGTARTWQYNDRGQLTREAAAGMMDFTYTFDAAQNDGRVKTRADAISGETVTYLYDKLGRLSSATATGAGVAWSQSFTHDGFGNLTQLTGSGTNLSLTVNDRNQITNGGASYDANGNRQSINGHTLGYDFENRLTSVTNVLFNDPTYQSYGAETYGYSTRGERLLVEHTAVGTSLPHYSEVRLYDPAGGLMGAYTFAPTCEAPCMPSFYVIEKHEKRRVYFAGRLVKVGTQIVATDRLGSVIALREQAYPNPVTRYRYYPYGEAIGTQEWDKPQFATYTRDGSSGLDDAMNRQYDRIWGRFTTPDPYEASAGTSEPGSWNRYAYVQGDPTNYHDPAGLLAAVPQGYRGLPGFSVSPDCGDLGLVSLSPLQRLSRVVESVEDGLVDWVRPDPEGRGYQIQVDAGTYDVFAERFAEANPIGGALEAPAPPLVKVLLVTGAVLYALADWWESRRNRTTCTVRCQVVDFTLGIDMAIGYIQSTQSGVTYRDACTLAKLDIDRKINAQYGTQHRKRHCKEQ